MTFDPFRTVEGKVDILALTPEELVEFFLSLGQPKYRATQVFPQLARGLSFDEITNLPKNLRVILQEKCLFTLPQVEKKLVSKIDGTVKYLFRLYDGSCIESVLMRYEHGNSLCISSQVGCRMGCRFCASTIGGKVRDLLPSELLGQVIAAQKDSGERVSNIVMMGIGEPLDNFDNVIRFLHLVNREEGLCIGYRHISLSTCGLADRIRDLAAVDLPITLSISLHAPTNEQRSAIMPVNRRYPLEELFAACRDYYKTTGRRISFEYTLISGKNDSESDARALADCLLRAFAGTGAPLHVNLIRVNEVEGTGFSRGTKESVNAFAAYLEKRGIVATVRRRLGADVNAACGQLRRSAAAEGKAET
jgi:23S rRNA (adenine2503-C2)-methyltransferase